MGTREEFEIQCPYCGKGMLERVAVRLLDDDFIIGTFRCQNCGQDVWVSSRRPVYKPLEELKAERGEIASKELDKLDKKIDKVRRERKENE